LVFLPSKAFFIKNHFNMANKTVLITGTSSGIGRAAAQYFAQKGWNVAATMRSPEKETELQKLPNLRVVRLDVTDPVSIAAAFDEAEKAFGAAVDVVVNNAGYGVDGVFEAMSDDVIRRQFETNVFGLMRVTREAIRRMRPRKSGAIIQIASVGGRTTFPLYSIYHSTKWAVEGFSESLHYELRQFNIKIRIIEPGAIKTEFYGKGREFVKPSDTTDYDALVEKCDKLSMETGDQGAAPEAVAKRIFEAANQSGWTLRFPIAYPANVLLPMRRLLPDSWVFWFTRMSYKI
jgi:NAD(P)-dependent dehydrogenase (short-subunit alcohol dehydrogenase family)